MNEQPYQRNKAVAYARKWALGRNPAYYDFDDLGGDCTNFVSQCVYAGAGVMNDTPELGWYYRSLADRSASWTGVTYFYRFMTTNQGIGPYAREQSIDSLKPGDVVQLGRSSGEFYHSLLVTATEPEILVAAHSYNALDRPLSTYRYDMARGIHFLAVRHW